MILTSLSDSEIKELENRVYDIAFEYEMMYDVMISVNIKNEEHFNYWLGALPYYAAFYAIKALLALEEVDLKK